MVGGRPRVGADKVSQGLALVLGVQPGMGSGVSQAKPEVGEETDWSCGSRPL